MNAKSATSYYKSVSLKTGVEGADAHRLIEMLLGGAGSKISEAKAHMRGGDTKLKGEAIGKAIAILEYLRASLDPGIDTQFAEQLGELYQYMERRLLEANLKNDELMLSEVLSHLNELIAGWSAIPAEYRG